MASFFIHSYSTSQSSGGQDASKGHKVMTDQEIGLIGGSSSSSSISSSTSESTESERVRLEDQVEMPAPSGNTEDVEQTNPPDNDWVVTDVRTAYSNYRRAALLELVKALLKCWFDEEIT